MTVRSFQALLADRNTRAACLASKRSCWRRQDGCGTNEIIATREHFKAHVLRWQARYLDEV